MNNFVVPQFIDVEAKILGPITLRQFIITLIGGLFAVIAYKLSDIGLFIIELLVIGGFVFLFGFFKVNGRGFHLFLLNVLETIKRPRIRVWQPKASAQIKASALRGDIGSMSEGLQEQKKPLTQSRLQELSLVVDTGGAYRTEEES